MNLPSTAWSARIGRGALAAVVLCGPVANAQPPSSPAGCANGPGDSCVTHSETYGWYPTRWRRWPDSGKALEPVPAKKPGAGEKPTDKSDDKSAKPPTSRPPLDESLPDRPQTPAPQSGVDGDLPPKPPGQSPDEMQMPSEALPPGVAPPVPLTEPSDNEAPRSEVPVEPSPPEPKPPKSRTPDSAPALPPGVDLPQPSLDDDLLNVLPKEKPSSEKPSSPGKTKPKSKTPETKPPTKSRVKEDPFIDDPAPSEAPPAQPREGHRQPASSEGESRLGGDGPNHLRWGSDESEAVRAAIPTALFRIDSPAAAAPQSTIEITDARPAERPATNSLRAAVAQRDANASTSGRTNPLRRGAPSKFLGVDAGSPDQPPPSGESAAAGSSIANPLR